MTLRELLRYLAVLGGFFLSAGALSLPFWRHGAYVALVPLAGIIVVASLVERKSRAGYLLGIPVFASLLGLIRTGAEVWAQMAGSPNAPPLIEGVIQFVVYATVGALCLYSLWRKPVG